jgi:SAM-dependent methyltransferase
MDRRQFELHAHMEDRHWWFLGRRRILLAMAAATAPRGDASSILDLGCGTGGITAALANQFGTRGIDRDPHAIELARTRFPHLEFRVAEPGDPVADELIGESDLVVSSDVMEHIADDRAFLDHIIAALSPGARILLTVPAHPELWSPHDVALGHHRRYTANTLRTVWDGRPVTPEFFSFFNSRLFPLARASRAISQIRGSSAGLQQTDLSLPPAPVNRILAKIFGGEARRLVCAHAGQARPFANGLSLMAVLRNAGEEVAEVADGAAP